MRQRVSVITPGVRDLARARAFYRELAHNRGSTIDESGAVSLPG